MKLIELMQKANAGYPDGFLANYYHPKTGQKKRGSGNGLAQFIAVELIETFSDDTDEDAQIQTAVQMLENAIRDIQATIDALEG